MSITQCKECGGQVSTKAKTCPACGAKPKRGAGVLGWLFATFLLAIILWNVAADNKKAAPIPNTYEPTSQGEPNWKQFEFTDDMTDEKTVAVSTRSSNGALFDFPYRVTGGSKLSLTFRRRAGNLDAYLKIDKGQMLCSSIDCHFNLRVGDGQVQKWTGLQSATHDHDIMFVRDSEMLEQIIKTGTPIRIAIPFYRAGEHTFTFDTSGYPGG